MVNFNYLQRIALYIVNTVFLFGVYANPLNVSKLNFVLVMSDDQGWGDIGYNNHPNLKTPVLDQMAATGIRFNRFYSAHPYCSPTRASYLTGRNPARMGTFSYNFSIRPGELTLPEVLQKSGYATGHFGKWHVGPVKAGSPLNPGNNGFDEWLSHDNFFELNPELSHNGQASTVYSGESSEILVDKAMEFMIKVQKTDKPFLTFIWFGSPHKPHSALQPDKDLYLSLDSAQQNYLGEITAMDRAIGKLRQGLKDNGLSNNTILWFCSDNGPDLLGLSGGLREKKGSLYEGGIRVPAILEWPDRITVGRETDFLASTVDIMPTILDLVNIQIDSLILDGISLKPLIDGSVTQRPTGLAFWKYPQGKETANGQMFTDEERIGFWRTFSNYKHPVAETSNFPGHSAWIEGKWKLHKKKGGEFELYNLETDFAETIDIASGNKALVDSFAIKLEDWQRSVEVSLTGQDYLTEHKITQLVRVNKRNPMSKYLNQLNGTRDVMGKSHNLNKKNTRRPPVILYNKIP